VLNCNINILFWKITTFLNMFYLFLCMPLFHLHVMVRSATIIWHQQKISPFIKEYIIKVSAWHVNMFLCLFLSLHDSFYLVLVCFILCCLPASEFRAVFRFSQDCEKFCHCRSLWHRDTLLLWYESISNVTTLYSKGTTFVLMPDLWLLFLSVYNSIFMQWFELHYINLLN